MISHYELGRLCVAPDPEPAQMAKYRKHVAAGTVPPDSQIPYTRTGVEKYRHRSRLDDFKPGRPPEYPAWTRTEHSVQAELFRIRKAGHQQGITIVAEYFPPKFEQDIKTYVRLFSMNRNLKEV